MVDTESDSQSLLQRLSKAERAFVQTSLAKRVGTESEIINKEIQTDREHLAIVNFCINRFAPKSYINAKTGYVWVRVEPLYGLGHKNFDIAIYNNLTKILILVECKSGLMEAEKELAEISGKISQATAYKGALEEMVGDKITHLEFSLCAKAGLAPRAKPVILSKGLRCCLWSADIFGSTLFAEKLASESETEISSGRLHREESLRKVLLEGVTERSSTRQVTFLPSSHMCSILEELVPLLRLELDLSENQSEEFGVGDVRNLIGREISLQNFDEIERQRLTEKVVHSALHTNIFDDNTPHVEDLAKKKLKLSSQSHSAGYLAKYCHDKYVKHHATENAITKTLQEFREKNESLEGFFKP